MNRGINHENIVLIGFMGTGKTSVGKLIASRLGYEFVDTDQLVVQRNGLEITDLFRQHGEAFFRDEETLALKTLQGRNGLVIATGGGIIVRQENVALLKQLGFIAWLTATRDVIYSRVSLNDKRPLLQTEDPHRTIDDLLDARKPLYSEAAQFMIDSSTLPHPRIADMIISAANA